MISAATDTRLRLSRVHDKHQDRGGGAVQRGLVGGVVAEVVVVHGSRVLEGGQRVGLADRDAAEASEDAVVHGTVHEAAADWTLGESRGHQVDILGEPLADPGEHGVAPRIAAQ